MQVITFDEKWPFYIKDGQKIRLNEEEKNKYGQGLPFTFIDWDITFQEKSRAELLREIQELRASKYDIWNEVGAVIKDFAYKRTLKADIEKATTVEELQKIMLRMVDPIDELDEEINKTMAIKKAYPKPINTDIQ